MLEAEGLARQASVRWHLCNASAFTAFGNQSVYIVRNSASEFSAWNSQHLHKQASRILLRAYIHVGLTAPRGRMCID